MRNRAEALLLASLTPYRWAKPAHVCIEVCVCTSLQAPLLAALRGILDLHYPLRHHCGEKQTDKEIG